MEFKVVKRGLGKNRKYYFKGSDGKIYGEGYDAYYFNRDKKGRKRLWVVEGFARVKKDDKWYLADVDNGFKLYGKGYEDIKLPYEGWAKVTHRELPIMYFDINADPCFYPYINLKELRETGVLYHYDSHRPTNDFFLRRLEDNDFYINIKELEETGDSHRYEYNEYREGFNVVYENGKYYFIDEDFKLHGEGYDEVRFFSIFSEGFAKVKKAGKWYYVDKDFKLHSEGYDKAYDFGGGFAKVKKGEQEYTINENFERIKRNNQIMEDVDYLQEAKDDVKSIVGIPAIRFSDDFVNKLKAIVLNHYEKEVEEAKSDKVEALRSEMEYIKKIIDEKKEQYSEKVADPNYQSLLKQAQSLFVKGNFNDKEQAQK